jgi:ABC-2 type transport system ATP-binding protein
VVAADRADLPRVAKAIARVADGEPESDETELRVHAPVTDRVAALTDVARTLQDEGVKVEDIGLRRPSLDDVFLRLTGHRAKKDEETAA